MGTITSPYALRARLLPVCGSSPAPRTTVRRVESPWAQGETAPREERASSAVSLARAGRCQCEQSHRWCAAEPRIARGRVPCTDSARGRVQPQFRALAQGWLACPALEAWPQKLAGWRESPRRARHKSGAQRGRHGKRRAAARTRAGHRRPHAPIVPIARGLRPRQEQKAARPLSDTANRARQGGGARSACGRLFGGHTAFAGSALSYLTE
jgi:hypothetical protein